MVERTWNMVRYNALQRNWAEFGPPVHRAVAAYLRLAGGKPKKAEDEGFDDFESYMRAIAPGGSG